MFLLGFGLRELPNFLTGVFFSIQRKAKVPLAVFP
jgi:hypothetical protein